MSAGVDFGPPRRRRRPGLTPMIDVVFLLLVFFMLVARFGPETALPVGAAGGAGAHAGPPRLVDVLPEGVRLNGAPLPDAALADALAPLMARPDSLVVLRAAPGATTERVIAVAGRLAEAGLGKAALVE